MESEEIRLSIAQLFQILRTTPHGHLLLYHHSLPALQRPPPPPSPIELSWIETTHSITFYKKEQNETQPQQIESWQHHICDHELKVGTLQYNHCFIIVTLKIC